MDNCHVAIAFDAKEIKHFIRVALSHQLFVKGWGLCDEMCHALENSIKMKKEVPSVTVALIKQTFLPVGVCLIKNGKVMVFIKPKYRRQGLATLAIHRLQAYWNLTNLTAEKGRPGSKAFWKSMNIEIVEQ